MFEDIFRAHISCNYKKLSRTFKTSEIFGTTKHLPLLNSFHDLTGRFLHLVPSLIKRAGYSSGIAISLVANIRVISCSRYAKALEVARMVTGKYAAHTNNYAENEVARKAVVETSCN